LDTLRLFVAEGEVVAAEAEFGGVAEGGAANDFDGGAVAEAHFEEAAAEFGVAGDGLDRAATADAHGVERAAGRGAGVGAAGEVTGFHD